MGNGEGRIAFRTVRVTAEVHWGEYKSSRAFVEVVGDLSGVETGLEEPRLEVLSGVIRSMVETAVAELSAVQQARKVEQEQISKAPERSGL